MKNKIVLGVLFLLHCSIPSLGIAQEYQKLAQTGFQFLSVSSDARVSALAGAVTSTELQSNSLFYNPAGMANMATFLSASFSHNPWIADIVHNSYSLAINPAHGKYGVFGMSVLRVDYGNLIGTRVSSNDQGFDETGIFSPSAYAIGFGYAKALTDRFSVGGQIKYTHQQLGENLLPLAGNPVSDNKLSPFAYDFGTLFKTGFKSLAFGMSVRNFSKEVKFAQEGFQLPLIFQMGISMNIMDFTRWHEGDHCLVLSVDATHDRSYSEQLIVGLDYTFMKVFSLRSGYISNNDENSISYGTGISYAGAELDYAYSPFGVFDAIQRFTIRFSI